MDREDRICLTQNISVSVLIAMHHPLLQPSSEKGQLRTKLLLHDFKRKKPICNEYQIGGEKTDQESS